MQPPEIKGIPKVAKLLKADAAVPEMGDDWTFKHAVVVSNFDKHVRGQLPWYDIMSGAVGHIARHYIPENGTVLDLGCSTGNVQKVLLDTLISRDANLIGIDNSPEMIEAYEATNNYGKTELICADYTEGILPEYDVCIMFLSFM